MRRTNRLVCAEVFDPADALTAGAAALYDATQHPDERIPWAWIERSLQSRPKWVPGTTARHLVVATSESEWASQTPHVAGFAYGMHLPGYGGYVSYLGVDPADRGRGVGTRLFTQLDALFEVDAAAVGEALPFTVWESKRPTPDAPEAEHALWTARLALFARAGGHLVHGLELHTPNYNAQPLDGEEVVTLQLFVKPVATPAASFTPDRLKAVAAGLLQRVYRLKSTDALYQATLPPDCRPRLETVAEKRPRLAGAGS